jgi:hypothetical protein
MAACIHSTRDVSRIQSDGDKWRTLGQVAGGSVPMLRARDGGAQLYELVGFPYYGRNSNLHLVYQYARWYSHCLINQTGAGVYLGLLDVYYAAGMCSPTIIYIVSYGSFELKAILVSGARQEVHCELAWSSDFRNWHRIDEGTFASVFQAAHVIYAQHLNYCSTACACRQRSRAAWRRKVF